MNSACRSLCSFWNSSIGKKLLVAITGLVLVLFLFGHMTGNLLVFAGREAFNDYAMFLHHVVHGTGIWFARIGLLVAVVLHVWATISLTRANRAARQPYECQTNIQASRSSRLMIWSGLTILFFVIYHLMHFTLHAGNDYETYIDPLYLATTGENRMDAWKMVIDGFSVWYVSIFYVIAMSVLCSHLGHGVASIFQTLGFNSKKSRPLIEKFSWAYSVVIWLGFVSVPFAVLIFGFGK
ncbi:MAG: succinate dehydrogenase cytochrome b subunit [Verrucomicrobiota bacterium]